MRANKHLPDAANTELPARSRMLNTWSPTSNTLESGNAEKHLDQEEEHEIIVRGLGLNTCMFFCTVVSSSIGG
jgi:hypothetical protein